MLQFYKLQEADDSEQCIAVPVYAIDDLVRRNHLQPPDFVKIDVEGHEIHVLRGMRETIRRYRPVILCEVHWLKKEVEALLQELFVPLGYRATQIDGRPLPDRPERYHLLLVPSDRIAPEAHEERRSG